MNRSIFASGFLALMGCFSLGAQSIKVTADVPFDFRVGQTLMPAGEYTITHAQGVLWLKTYSGRPKGVSILVYGTQKGSGGGASNKLVFNRYGNDYFLSRVYQLGETTGLVVPPGKIEKETIAGRDAPVQTAAVNVRAR